MKIKIIKAVIKRGGTKNTETFNKIIEFDKIEDYRKSLKVWGDETVLFTYEEIE